jgi:limonene-1,2-epoxide hydrolase
VSLPFVSIQVLAGGRIALWRDYSNIDTCCPRRRRGGSST